MKLAKVNIKNFRSIKEETIRFNPKCRVLVGINESGKSNILKALYFLSDEYDPEKSRDLREALPLEDPIEKSYVRFVFKFNKEEQEELTENICSGILTSKKNPRILATEGKFQTLKKFCTTQNEGLYKINILDEDKNFLYWKIIGDLVDGWKKPSSSCPPDFKIEVKEEEYALSEYKLINGNDFPDIPEEYLDEADTDDFTDMAGEHIKTLTEKNLPEVIFWVYEEDNLLPSEVKIEEFKASPDSCAPLKNMFALAGITNIQESIDDAKKRGNNQFQNYLDSIAKKNTNHFSGVWKEYKNIDFSLRLNGEQIEPGVKEKNTLDFKKRSDGFKRFVTFLLMISVNVKTNSLNNILLLIDEPEISLHPSGARFLRDELIKISNTNNVIYSTHSIFMIDSGDISRHYIVKKKDEITSVEEAKDSNIADEEVLYNALGHSVFSVLKDKNIIFEGWKDKCLFLTALSNADSKIKDKFKNYGICHAKGVGTIKTITPMLKLANRKCLIVSDCDKPAKDKQKIYKQDKGYGEWKTYKDINATIPAITGEDFIDNDYIVKNVNSVFKKSTLPNFEVSILGNNKKLDSIFRWMTDNNLTKEQANEKLDEVKNSLFGDLKTQHIISGEYEKLLKGIKIKQ